MKLLISFSSVTTAILKSCFSNVQSEVRHQVKRLISHPSIIIFSGNNENEGVLANNWYNTAGNFSLYKADYIKLYVDTIKKEFLELTHNRSLFITSSPTNGKESVEEGYVARSPGSEFYGDVHYYNYILDPFNSNLYPVPRFSSEYGYQSLPSIDSLLTATNLSTDLDYNGKFFDHRQHHPAGNAEMILLMNYQFQLPSNNNSLKYLEAIVYFSQVCQAMAIKVETERYRSYRNRIDQSGKGYTMGALYWQLNDVWIAPSWSGIDYTGKWKMLQYFTQDFFAPIIITGYVNFMGQMELYAVSDLLSPIFNVTVTLQVYNWLSFEAVSNEMITIDLEPTSVKLVKKMFIDDYLIGNKCGTLTDAKKHCFFHFTLQKEGVKVTPENFVVPTSFKSANLQQTNVQISSILKIGHNGTFKLEITTDQIAAFVWLDCHNIHGKFSENGFLMVTKSRESFFYSEKDVSEEDLRSQLTITNLKDKRYMF